MLLVSQNGGVPVAGAPSAPNVDYEKYLSTLESNLQVGF